MLRFMESMIISFLIMGGIYAQSPDQVSNDLFARRWIYPASGTTSLVPYIMQDKIIQQCLTLPPDSLRTFGNIRGMGCDANDNLYVWDDGYQALWKFNGYGQKIWRRKYKNGTGNGEFTKVGPAFCVSRDGQICLGDRISKTVTLLDSSGEFLSKFSIPMWPGSMTFGPDGTIYMDGFPMSYSGNLVQHYSTSGAMINSFCERSDTSYAMKFSGNTGRLSVGPNGNIYYAHFYPYRVDEYAKDGSRIRRMENARAEFAPPYVEKGVIMWTSGVRGIVNLPNGSTFVVAVTNEQKNEWGIDVLDRSLSVIRHISKEQFPREFWYRYWTVDSQGDVYFDLFTDSGPMIIKYRIDPSLFAP